MKKLLLAFLVVTFLGACKSNKDTANTTTTERPSRGERGGQKDRPNVAEMFQQMDANKDGKLSMTEVKGPLQKDFAKIDTDSNGFISMEEMKKAPKPQRGQRPQRNN